MKNEKGRENEERMRKRKGRRWKERGGKERKEKIGEGNK